MTREEKIKKRKERANNRANKRAEKYRNFLNKKTNAISLGGFYIAKQNYWEDETSPTGFMRVCDYAGVCQHPCNGDC